MNDYLSDMLTRIRNGQSIHKLSVKQKKIKICILVLNVLWEEGYIRGYNFSVDNPNEVNILLKYHNNLPVIKKIERVSKPSKRIYSSIKSLWQVNNTGIYILSTPKGILSDIKAKQLNTGGEVICKVM
jgi:small subunit ribosomal protein S8